MPSALNGHEALRVVGIIGKRSINVCRQSLPEIIPARF